MKLLKNPQSWHNEWHCNLTSVTCTSDNNLYAYMKSIESGLSYSVIGGGGISIV